MAFFVQCDLSHLGKARKVFGAWSRIMPAEGSFDIT